MRNFRELNIWKKGLNIAELVYSIFPELPDYEKFGLQAQLAKSSVSIPSNIAEGSSRSSAKDYKRFLEIALGSSFELETQVIILVEIIQNKNEELDKLLNLIDEEQKMMMSFIKKVAQNI